VGWADPWIGAGLRAGESLFPIFSSSIPFLFVLFLIYIPPFDFNVICRFLIFGLFNEISLDT
jgi:hypothetical protein